MCVILIAEAAYYKRRISYFKSIYQLILQWQT